MQSFRVCWISPLRGWQSYQLQQRQSFILWLSGFGIDILRLKLSIVSRNCRQNWHWTCPWGYTSRPYIKRSGPISALQDLRSKCTRRVLKTVPWFMSAKDVWRSWRYLPCSHSRILSLDTSKPGKWWQAYKNGPRCFLLLLTLHVHTTPRSLLSLR